MNIKGKYDPISEDSSDENSNASEQLPIKIKWPKKKRIIGTRNRYNNYNEENLDWDYLFLCAKNLKENGVSKFLKKTAKKYNINYKTFRNKYSKWEEECTQQKTVENRGNDTVFSNEEEKDLFEYIKNVYVETNLFFDDMCLQLVAKRKWDTLHPDRKDDFKASRYWAYSFKKRWKLSSFKGRNSKKAKFTDLTEGNLFIQKCKKFLCNNPSTHLFNMDETFWRFLNGNLDVIGIKGSENRKVITGLTGKEGFSAIFLISADGKFCTPTLIFKGKTTKCLQKINLSDSQKEKINLTFSDSGWNNTNITLSILEQINKITNGNPSALILDQHKSHIDDLINSKAKEFRIQLIYVPVGQTANLQPLDISINGVVKSISHKYIKDLYVDDPYYIPTFNDAVYSLLNAINKIDSKTIQKSFAVLYK